MFASHKINLMATKNNCLKGRHFEHTKMETNMKILVKKNLLDRSYIKIEEILNQHKYFVKFYFYAPSILYNYFKIAKQREIIICIDEIKRQLK